MFLSELLFGKVDIERDVQVAVRVVVLVAGHALALLLDACARPRDLVAHHFHLVTVQMIDVELEAVERVLQRDRYVRVQVIAASLESRMSEKKFNF